MSETRTRVARVIAADPTSTALLMAGPSAIELWPTARRVGAAGRRALVEAEPGRAAVRALPPRRTPTAYVSRFAWSGEGLPEARCELVLAYVPGTTLPSTHAALTVVTGDLHDTALDERRLKAMAEGFLANLADAAESRSTAA